MIALRQDITKIAVDCIVNAANETLLGGGGVDGAIHRAAGPQLFQECLKLKGCNPGQAKLTKGYNLPCDYIIHTVGPIYKRTPQHEKVLRECYKNCLDIAKENNFVTIAFPSISTGVYGYPKTEAIPIAISTIKEWKIKNNYDINVYVCCFDEETYMLYNRYLEVGCKYEKI